MLKSHLGMKIQLADLESDLRFCREQELDVFQLSVGDTNKRPESDFEEARKYVQSFPCESLSAGWCKPAVWNFREGPQTLGLTPLEYREDRMNSLLCAAEWTSRLGIPRMQTHFGFIPENPGSPEYAEHVECLRKLARRCSELGIQFCLETGQETPITLRRAIEDAGEKCIGINLDPANLLMYGKANPADAMDVFGDYVASLHLKDGCYPGTDSYSLGPETRIGEGRVDFLSIFRKLAARNFTGPLFFEREIPLPQRNLDIAASIPLVRGWMSEV